MHTLLIDLFYFILKQYFSEYIRIALFKYSNALKQNDNFKMILAGFQTTF